MAEIVIHKIVPVSVPVVTSDNVWAEFGQLGETIFSECYTYCSGEFRRP